MQQYIEEYDNMATDENINNIQEQSQRDIYELSELCKENDQELMNNKNKLPAQVIQIIMGYSSYDGCQYWLLSKKLALNEQIKKTLRYPIYQLRLDWELLIYNKGYESFLNYIGMMDYKQQQTYIYNQRTKVENMYEICKQVMYKYELMLYNKNKNKKYTTQEDKQVQIIPTFEFIEFAKGNDELQSKINQRSDYICQIGGILQYSNTVYQNIKNRQSNNNQLFKGFYIDLGIKDKEKRYIRKPQTEQYNQVNLFISQFCGSSDGKKEFKIEINRNLIKYLESVGVKINYYIQQLRECTVRIRYDMPEYQCAFDSQVLQNALQVRGLYDSLTETVYLVNNMNKPYKLQLNYKHPIMKNIKMELTKSNKFVCDKSNSILLAVQDFIYQQNKPKE